MKHLLILTLCAAVLLPACKDDVIDFVYDPGRMHYDGPNANAPLLFSETSIYAAKFPRAVLRQYEGKVIDGVQLYIFTVPEIATLVVYEEGNNSSPGEVIFEVDITNLLTADAWNTITLPSPLEIPSSGELWIALRATDPNDIQVMGCDAGPNRAGGDWLFQDNDNAWRTFRSRSGDSINWNIRAVID